MTKNEILKGLTDFRLHPDESLTPVRGDSMEPRIPDGAVALCRYCKRNAIRNGGVYAVAYIDEDLPVITLKRLLWRPRMHWVAVADNPFCRWAKRWPQGRPFLPDECPEVLSEFQEVVHPGPQAFEPSPVNILHEDQEAYYGRMRDDSMSPQVGSRELVMYRKVRKPALPQAGQLGKIFLVRYTENGRQVATVRYVEAAGAGVKLFAASGSLGGKLLGPEHAPEILGRYWDVVVPSVHWPTRRLFSETYWAQRSAG